MIPTATGLSADLGYAVLFTLIMCAFFLLYNLVSLGSLDKMALRKTLRITIPEDLDYTSVFDDLFAEYTSDCQLVKVRTTNMGSMFRLTYDLTLRDARKEKEFIDMLRTRNGNLEITVSREAVQTEEL